MNTLSIEELKDMREFAQKRRYTRFVQLIDEAIAIRELKGEQVPVAWIVRPSMESDVAYVETDPRSLDTLRKAGVRLTPLFTAPQKPVFPVELREDILRCVDDSMHGCNSLSAPDYAVRVAGWLAFGGTVSRWESSGFGVRNICPQCTFIRNVTCTCKINLLGDDNDKAA